MCKTLVLHCLGWFCLPPSSLPKNKQMPAMASSGFFLPTWDTKGRNPLILCSLHSWKRELAFLQLGDSSLLTFQYWLITYYILDVWISLLPTPLMDSNINLRHLTGLQYPYNMIPSPLCKLFFSSLFLEDNRTLCEKPVFLVMAVFLWPAVLITLSNLSLGITSVLLTTYLGQDVLSASNLAWQNNQSSNRKQQ